MGREIPLVCHPDTGPGAVRALCARAWRADAGSLVLGYRLEGDLARIRVPPGRSPGGALRDPLWKHTCFEAFLGVEGEAAYHELNFSPAGKWQVHAFRAWRDGGPVTLEGFAPAIRVRLDARTLELEATLRLEALGPGLARASLRLALSAVVEAYDGTLSYWAIRHPEATPDFHHPDGFALRLEPE